MSVEMEEVGVLDEQLAVTLVSRFLNHLEAADTPSLTPDRPADLEDAIIKNLLAVGKFLAKEDIRWGKKDDNSTKAFEAEDAEEEEASEADTEKTKEQDLAKSSSARVTSKRSAPLAIVVLTDKIGKIGRKAKQPGVIGACLKLHAAFLLSRCLPVEQSEAVEPVLRLCEHVQTAVVGRVVAHSDDWKSCQELAKTLSGRLAEMCGDEAFVALKVSLAKKLASAKKDRKMALKLETVKDPERAAKRKNEENRRKREKMKAKRTEKTTNRRHQ